MVTDYGSKFKFDHVEKNRYNFKMGLDIDTE